MLGASLLPGPGGTESEGAASSVTSRTAAAAVTTMLVAAFMGLGVACVGSVLEPQSPAQFQGQVAVLQLSSSSLISYVAWWKRHGFWLVEAGRVLLVFVLLGAGLKIGPSGFIGIAKHFQFPLPIIMGPAAAFFCVVGSLLVIGGPLVGSGLASIVGAKMGIVFMIPATYSGHLKPLSTAEGDAKKSHEQHLGRNIAIIGGLVVVIASDLPSVHLAAFSGWVNFWQYHALLVGEVGRFLVVFPCLGAAGALGVGGFTGIATHLKYPMPAFMGMMAVLFTGLGSVFVVAGPALGCALLSIAGAKMLIIFLVIASYSGHYKPMLASEGAAKTDHEQSLGKNASIIGALIMIIGYALPGLGYGY